MGEDILVKDSKVNSGSQSKSLEYTNLVEMASQDSDLNFVKQKLESLHKSIIKDVDQKMTTMIDDVLQEIRQKELQTNEFNHFAKNHSKNNATWSNRLPRTAPAQTDQTDQTGQTDQPDNANNKDKTARQRRALPDKVFVARESYLTALLEVNHMKSIYNIFFTALVILFLNTVCYDMLVKGRASFGLRTMKQGFANIHRVMGTWSLMHIPILGVYYALKMWANIRRKLMNNRTLQSLWSYSWLTVFVAFQMSMLYIGTITCLELDLPYVTACVMLLETTRLIMKVHGFVRSNAGRILDTKSKTDGDKVDTPVPMPPISCYLYYLFAPTLIYRDSYPRTNQIRWKFALNRLLEVIAIAFLYSYIYERHIHFHFANYGIEELTNASLIVKLFGMIMPSFIVFLCAFYLILHAWLNFTAELLRFGDRMFYKDWWTCCNYEAYYRNWNVVVHDWLYEYIYKDCYNHIFKGSKVASSMVVFFVSAYAHEHILAFALQMFYPVMFVSFGLVGVVLVFITKDFPVRFGNIFLWFTLITGGSVMISMYAMEYFARQNCPAMEAKNLLEWLTPVSWVCNGRK